MNIQQQANELEVMINKFSKMNFMLTPQVCYSCKRLIMDKVSLEFLYEVGECPVCDHNYGETLERGDNL